MGLDYVDHEKSKKKNKKRLNDDDRVVIEKLIKKHGQDFERMQRDLKLNLYQWSEAEC